MKIGVTGATGHVGRLVIDGLKLRGGQREIVALARSPQKAADLVVETREFIYDKPEGLSKALTGIDVLMLISGSEVGQRIRQHANIINAARDASIKWIVYTSLLHADVSSISLAEEHSTTELLIKKSGISYTFLRNSWYTENYTGSISAAIAGGEYPGSAGNGKLSTATRADYAEGAVSVLTSEGHLGKTYEFAGDVAYTLSELAAEISRQTGKNIPYKNLPEHEYAAILISRGVPEGIAMAIAGYDVAASKGDLFDSSHQLSKLIGRKTTPLSVSVTQALSKLNWLSETSPRL